MVQVIEAQQRYSVEKFINYYLDQMLNNSVPKGQVQKGSLRVILCFYCNSEIHSI